MKKIGLKQLRRVTSLGVKYCLKIAVINQFSFTNLTLDIGITKLQSAVIKILL